MRVHEGVDEERGHAVDQQTGDDMLQDVSPDRRAVAEHDAMLTPHRGLLRGRTDPAGGQSVATLPHGCAAEPHGVFLSFISAQKQESPWGLPSVSASSPEISS